MINLLIAIQLNKNPILDKPKEKPAIVQPAPKPVTESDNPQHCDEATQWIASEAPFYCIPKQVPQPTVKAATQPQNVSGNLYDYHSCTWWVKNNRPSIPNTWGDATTWLANAQRQGYSTGAIPRPGAVGWTYGHVVYVIAVNGSTITIGDGNYDYNGSYRIREANASEFLYIF